MILFKNREFEESQLDFATLPKLQVKIDGANCIDWIVSTDGAFRKFFFVPRVERSLSDRFSADAPKICENNNQLGGLTVEVSTLTPERSRRVSMKLRCLNDAAKNSSDTAPILSTNMRPNVEKLSSLLYHSRKAEGTENGESVSGLLEAYGRLRNALRMKIVRNGERKTSDEHSASTTGDVVANVTSMMQKQVQPIVLNGIADNKHSVVHTDLGLEKVLSVNMSDDQFHKISNIMMSVTPPVGDPRLHKAVSNKVELDKQKCGDERDSGIIQMEDSVDLWEESLCLHRIRNPSSGKSSSNPSKIPNRSETWKMLDEAYVRPKSKSLQPAVHNLHSKTPATLKLTEAVVSARQYDLSKVHQSAGTAAANAVSGSFYEKKAEKGQMFFHGKPFVLSKEQPRRAPLVQLLVDPALDPRIASNRPSMAFDLKLLHWCTEFNLINGSSTDMVPPGVESQESLSTSTGAILSSSQHKGGDEADKSSSFADKQLFLSRELLSSNEEEPNAKVQQFKGPHTPPEVEMCEQETVNISSAVVGFDSVHHKDSNCIMDIVQEMCARVEQDCVEKKLENEVSRVETIYAGPLKEPIAIEVVGKKMVISDADVIEDHLQTDQTTLDVCDGAVNKVSFPNLIIEDHPPQQIEEKLQGKAIQVQVGLCALRQPSFLWEGEPVFCLGDGSKSNTNLLSEGELEESCEVGEDSSIESVGNSVQCNAHADRCRSVDERLINLWMKMQKVRLENLESSSYHDGYFDSCIEKFQNELLLIRKLHFGIAVDDQNSIGLISAEEPLPKKIPLDRSLSSHTDVVSISEISGTENDSRPERVSESNDSRPEKLSGSNGSRSRKRLHRSRHRNKDADHRRHSKRRSSSARKCISGVSESSHDHMSVSSDTDTYGWRRRHEDKSQRMRSTESLRHSSSKNRSVIDDSVSSSGEISSSSNSEKRYQSHHRHEHGDKKRHSRTSSKHSSSRKRFVSDDDSSLNQRKRSKSASSHDDLSSSNSHNRSRHRHKSDGHKRHSRTNSRHKNRFND